MEEHCKELTQYILDLYIETKKDEEGNVKYKSWVIDINPWLEKSVDPLLFSWQELDQFNSDGSEKFEIRIIDSQSKI